MRRTRAAEYEFLDYIDKSFRITGSEMRKIMRDFHSEMARGLAGRKSSLKMIPAFVTKPTGNEKGSFFAIDLGGTNLRISEAELQGNGKCRIRKTKNFVLNKRYLKSGGEELFNFIADRIKSFIKAEKMDSRANIDLGFTFSFPMEQRGPASGKLLHWTKGFNVKGVIGEDVVRLLKEAMARRGTNNINIRALTNDTVGTFFARAYEDRNCDIGVIIGTGTNACYSEELANIPKWKGPYSPKSRMIINIEWGNFNKLQPTSYDRRLDKATNNPGQQVLEKMVSGMYLGELTRLVFKDLIKRKMLFEGSSSPVFDKAYNFKTEYMSRIEEDRSRRLSDVGRLLKKLGISNYTLSDRRLVRKICELISMRAARISAAALAGILAKMDPRMERRHTIAIDGSVYEKHPGFSNNMKDGLKELFGRRYSLIKLILTKDGSGKGAAIMAGVAGTFY